MNVTCEVCKGELMFQGETCYFCGGVGYTILRERSIPDYVSLENIYRAPAELWEEYTDEGKRLFNFLFEFIDRNQDECFATDVFRLDGFTNEQVRKVYGIIEAARYNISCIAAEYVSLNNTQTP